MSTIPTAYRTIIDPLIGVARDLVERGEQLVPLAFVGDLSKRETYPVLLNASSAQAKDDSAELIRQLAVIHESDFVLSSWTPGACRRTRCGVGATTNLTTSAPGWTRFRRLLRLPASRRVG